MASVDGGASVLTGSVTSRQTPAGANNSPSTSGQAYSEETQSSTFSNSDACDYGASVSTQTGIPPGQSPGTTLYFRMRGQDKNVGGRYDTWTVLNAPDFTGAQYTGSLTTPLRDISVTASWRR